MREASLYLNNFPRDIDSNQMRHIIFYLPLPSSISLTCQFSLAKIRGFVYKFYDII